MLRNNITTFDNTIDTTIDNSELNSVTKNYNYALTVANLRAAVKPAGGWPPKEHFVMTP
jgi:hypothetical protein